MNAYLRKVQYYETDMMGAVHHANYTLLREEKGHEQDHP